MREPGAVRPDAIIAMTTYLSRPRTYLSNAIHILINILQAKDASLLEHGKRTACYAMAMGNAIGISARDLLDLYYAALFHDIGQVMLPDDILQKNGLLTHEEYAFVQCHPRDGAWLLHSIPCLRRSAILIAHHHEHWDGSGYPYGLRNTFIPLGSRILAIADRFDALCTGRDGSHVDERVAINLIRILGGSQLDPMLVGVFVDQMQRGHSRSSFGGSRA